MNEENLKKAWEQLSAADQFDAIPIIADLKGRGAEAWDIGLRVFEELVRADHVDAKVFRVFWSALNEIDPSRSNATVLAQGLKALVAQAREERRKGRAFAIALGAPALEFLTSIFDDASVDGQVNLLVTLRMILVNEREQVAPELEPTSTWSMLSAEHREMLSQMLGNAVGQAEGRVRLAATFCIVALNPPPEIAQDMLCGRDALALRPAAHAREGDEEERARAVPFAELILGARKTVLDEAYEWQQSDYLVRNVANRVLCDALRTGFFWGLWERFPRGDRRVSGALVDAIGEEAEEDDLFRLALLDFKTEIFEPVVYDEETGEIVSAAQTSKPKSAPTPGTFEANFVAQLRTPETSISPVLLIDEFRRRLAHDFYDDDEPTKEMLVRAFLDAIECGGWRDFPDSSWLTEEGSAEISAILMLSSPEIESVLTDYPFVIEKLEKWFRDKTRAGLSRLAAFISLNDPERRQAPPEALFEDPALYELILNSEVRPVVILKEVRHIASGHFWLSLWSKIDLSNALHAELLSIVGAGLVRSGYVNEALACLNHAVPRDPEDEAEIKTLLGDVYDALGQDAPASQARAEAGGIQNTKEALDRARQQLLVSSLPFPVAVIYDRCVGLVNNKHGDLKDLEKGIADCVERAIHIQGLWALAELRHGGNLDQLNENMKKDLGNRLRGGSFGGRVRIWEVVAGLGDMDAPSVRGAIKRCVEQIGKDGRKEVGKMVERRNDRAHRGEFQDTLKREVLEKHMILLESLLETISAGGLGHVVYFEGDYRNENENPIYRGIFITGASDDFNHVDWFPSTTAPPRMKPFLHFNGRLLPLHPFLGLNKCEHSSSPRVSMLDRIIRREPKHALIRTCQACKGGTPPIALAELGVVGELFPEIE